MFGPMRSDWAPSGQHLENFDVPAGHLHGDKARAEKGRLTTTGAKRGASGFVVVSVVALALTALLSTGAVAQSGDTDLDEASEEVDREDSADKGTGLTLQQRIKAVSRPVFVKKGRFEATPLLGFSANDAFFQRLQVGARASYHIFEWLSAEAGGAVNYFSVPLQSVRLLAADPLEIVDPAPLLGYADVGVNFAPLYAKAALVSEWVVHFDAFATAGIGAVFDLAPGDAPVHPALSLGIGARAFITEWLVFRVDLKNFTFPNQLGTPEFTISNDLYLNIGVGFYFPFSNDDDEDVVKVVG